MPDSSAFSVGDLTCEYHDNPLGIETAHPRLSWKIRSDRRGARQTAYQIQAAGSPEDLAAGKKLLWDSGRVESDRSTLVPYGGKTLVSRQVVWWQAQAWDESGQPSGFSAPARWEMGLLQPGDWQADWIGAALAGSRRATVPAPYFRRTFSLKKPVAQARLYVTAFGLHECWLNGKPTSPDVFAPGWTDYNKRVQYQVYDVTGLLRQGENVLGALLGDGWYCGSVGWVGRQVYGDRPKLLAQLEVQHADGSTTVVASGPDWRYAFGPVIESDFQLGESYDARLEMPGWNAPGFDASTWQPVVVFPDGGAQRVARRGPAVQRITEVQPVGEPREIRDNRGSHWIFDMGQNMVGWVRLKVKGPAGQMVVLRFTEMLNPDGTLYTTNLRTARSTDYYTLKGDGEEVFEPHFTFHGFRFVELTGYPGVPGPDAVTGIVIHSDMPVTGSFECSDPLINQLQHNIQWGQRGNFVDVPTDCPQRDERLGWTGDAQVFVRTAAFNMHVAPFFTKWVQDVEDAQSPLGQVPPVVPFFGHGLNPDGGPAWADAFTIVPWTIYLCFGDRELLADHFPAMKRYVDHLVAMSQGLIRGHPDKPFENGDWDGYGDWLSINAETPKELIGTAFLAYSARLLAKMADVLGREEDCQEYQQVYEDTRKAFIHRYVTGDGLVAGMSQTAYVLALHFDLLPEDLRPRAVTELVRDIHKRKMHLSTGFVGAPYLMHVLSRAGQYDTAYQLLHQKSWPSWLYSVTQGATTIWERWDGWTHDKGFQDPGMNSFNHYAYGSIGDWLYAVVAGIDLDPRQPGYKHVLLKPQPGGGLAFARAEVETMYGKVASGWKIEDGTFTWEVNVPPNASATLRFPVKEGTAVLENVKPLDEAPGVDAVDGRSCRVGAGRYVFQAPASALE